MITNRTYGMDTDVISYNARIVAGGNQSLSMQSLRQVNQFVISIKKMGLWYNMVCWPLRANQNETYLSVYESYISNGADWLISNLGSTFIARFTISYFTS